MIGIRAGLRVIATVVATPLAAQDMTFTIDPTSACLAAQDRYIARLQCAGKAATACMDVNLGGTTTVGMGRCLDLEAIWWDKQLNVAYGKAMARAKVHDGEVKELGGFAPSQVDALREMQRAWIPFRDRLCDFERAQWGGGTGGGPAALGCLLQETARQTLLLEDVVRDY